MQIPAWPFVALSFGVGVFALGPYFALWTPSREALAPPKPRELEGWRNVGLKGTESSIGSWLILAGALVTVSQVGAGICSVVPCRALLRRCCIYFASYSETLGSRVSAPILPIFLC